MKKFTHILLSLSILLCTFIAYPITASAATYNNVLWPVSDRPIVLSRGYSSGHTALDILPRYGGNHHVLAAMDGTVVDWSNSCPHVNLYGDRCATWGKGGNYVVLQHSNGIRTHYAHLKQNTLNNIYNGKNVKQGEILAQVGSSGSSTGEHLHFTFIVNGINVNNNQNGGVIGYIYEAAAAAPSAPTGVSLSASNVAAGATITVNWSGATGIITRYDARLVRTSDNVEIAHHTPTGTSTQFTINNAGSYRVYVRAVGSNGLASAYKESGVVVVHAPSIVKFLDWDGTVLSTQTISYGSNAVAPMAPSREGYIFQNWDGSYYNVVSPVTLTATYLRIRNTVTFQDYDGSTLKSEQVYYGDSATAPNTPSAPSGYYFQGWDRALNNIRENMTIKPVYVWSNTDLPVVASITSAGRNIVASGYNISVGLSNYPARSTRAKIIAMLKTTEGKMVASETETISLAANETTSRTIYVPYEGMATVAEINVVDIIDNDKTGVPIATTSTYPISLGLDWSAWQTTYPAGPGLEIESRTEYRYSDKQLATSQSSVMSGWNLNNSTSTISYTPWSAWSDSQYYSSTTRQIETQSVYLKSQWKYMHYSNGIGTSSTASPVANGNVNKYHETWWIDYQLSQNGVSSYGGLGIPKYGLANFSCGCGNIWWYNPTMQQVNKTQWRYRDIIQTATYHFWRWNPIWSDWDATIVTSNDNMQVETRTTYRYKTSSVIEDMGGMVRNISGSLDSSAAGKKATLMVYKGLNDDPTASQLEYVAQTTLGANGEYAFTFKTKDEPSEASGDFTVLLGIEGATAPFFLETILAPKPNFTVSFVDDDGIDISTQTVQQGGDATPPASVSKAGHTFINWDYGYKNVQSDITIQPIYNKNKYNVVFIDWDSKLIDILEFEYDDVLAAPFVDDDRDGEHFVGWDTVVDGVAKVQSNMIITAQYAANVYDIIFYNWDGTEISRQTVQHGGQAILPPAPAMDDMVFDGWSDDFGTSYVTSDLQLQPMFIYLTTVETPSANIPSGTYNNAQTVALSSTTPGASIYYTLLDSLEDEWYVIDSLFERDELGNVENATLYTSPIVLPQSKTIAYQAFMDGKNASPLIVDSYTIQSGGGNNSPDIGSGSNPGTGSSGGGGGGGGGGVNTPMVTPTPTPTPSTQPSPTPTSTQQPTNDRTLRNDRLPRGFPVITRQMIDIASTHWAAVYIYDLVGRGIVDGYPLPDGTFEYRPGNEITRAEVMKLITASLDIDQIENYDGSAFADWAEVPDWAKPYVAALVDAGIVYGSRQADGIYVFADNQIIREEMIAMIIRSLNTEAQNGGSDDITRTYNMPPDFDKVSDWAKEDVAFAVQNDMINIDADGTVNPARNAKRDETAMILYKLLQYLEL